MGEQGLGSSSARASRAWLLYLAALAAVAFAAVMLSTARGLRVTPDSVTYMDAARSLAEGRGLTVDVQAGTHDPLTHFPPLPPAMLAAPAALGVDVLVAARCLDGLLLAGSALLVAGLVYRYTADKRLAVLGAALAMVGRPMLRSHTALMSEPPFMFLVLLGTLLLDIHLERPRASLLLGSAVAFALAQLTRWTAAPFIAAAGLVLLLEGRGKASRRLWECALFGLVALLPALLWVLRNEALAGTATNRMLVYHPVTVSDAREAVQTLTRWVVPWRAARWLRVPYLVPAAVVWLGAGLWVGGGGYLLWKRMRTGGLSAVREGVWRPPSLVLVGLAAYLVFLAVSMSFFDAHISLEGRILLPVYPAGVVVALYLANLIVVSLHGERARRRAMVGLCLLCTLAFVPQGVAYMLVRSRDGAEYTSRPWRDSPTLKAALARASTSTIYTNEHWAFYVVGGVRVHSLPHQIKMTTTLANEQYGEELAAMMRDMKEHEGLVVYFRRKLPPRGLPSEEELVRELPLKLLQSFPDGAIYGVAPE